MAANPPQLRYNSQPLTGFFFERFHSANGAEDHGVCQLLLAKLTRPTYRAFVRVERAFHQLAGSADGTTTREATGDLFQGWITTARTEIRLLSMVRRTERELLIDLGDACVVGARWWWSRRLLEFVDQLLHSGIIGISTSAVVRRRVAVRHACRARSGGLARNRLDEVLRRLWPSVSPHLHCPHNSITDRLADFVIYLVRRLC